MQINNNYSVLTPTITGGDVSVGAGVNGNIISITGVPPMDIREIQSTSGVIAPVAETLAVFTVTPPATPTASASYGYRAQQVVNGSNPPLFNSTPTVPTVNTVICNIQHSVNAGGETKVFMMNAIEKGLLSYVNPNVGLSVTSSTNQTTGVETITAKAGNPILSIQDLSTPPAALTILNTVAGVMSAGTVADLVALGVNPSLLTTGHVYGMIIFNFSQVESGGNDFPALTFSWTLFIDQTANGTNYTNFVNALLAALPDLT